MQNKKFLAFLGYATFRITLFVFMPPNPDKISAPMELVNGFRALSAGHNNDDLDGQCNNTWLSMEEIPASP